MSPGYRSMTVTEEPPQEPEHPAGPRSALRVATQRNFAPYFVGNMLGASGTWFANLAAALLIYRLTHSPFLLGVLNFAQFVPVLALAPWAGNAADRYDRRKLLIVAQAASFVLSIGLGLLALAEKATPAVVIGFALGLGVVNAFAAPAQHTLIGSLVPPRDLGAAVALHSMGFNLARAVGPALAAVVIAAFGIPTAFFVNAASFLLFLVGLVYVRPRAQQRAPHARLRDSIKLLRTQPRLLWLLFVVAAVGFASDPINTESPAFARAFGHPDTHAGLIIGVFGIGAVTAAFAMAGRVGSARITVAMLAVLAGGISLFSLSPTLWIALPFLFVAGFAYLTANTRATTQLQLEVEESHRGRIMALWTIAFVGLRPLASLADGAIASGFGVRAAGVALTLPAVVAAVLIWRRIRRSEFATVSR
jgi:MFS family permease